MTDFALIFYNFGPESNCNSCMVCVVNIKHTDLLARDIRMHGGEESAKAKHKRVAQSKQFCIRRGARTNVYVRFARFLECSANFRLALLGHFFELCGGGGGGERWAAFGIRGLLLLNSIRPATDKKSHPPPSACLYFNITYGENPFHTQSLVCARREREPRKYTTTMCARGKKCQSQRREREKGLK